MRKQFGSNQKSCSYLIIGILKSSFTNGCDYDGLKDTILEACHILLCRKYIVIEQAY